MSRRRTRALSALVLPLTAAPLAVATPALAHAHARAARTVTVVEHANTDTEIPVAPGGKDEKGDPLTFVNPIFNARDSRRVGHDEGYCMRLDPKRGVWECEWTTFLAGGQLTVQGPFYDTRDSVMSVTGGTGRYATARGQMKLHALHGGKEYRFAFELR